MVMAVGKEDTLHMTTEGRASQFASFQAAKKAGIQEFKSLTRGGFIETEMKQHVAPKASKPRDQARGNCTAAVLTAISEYPYMFECVRYQMLKWKCNK